MKNKNFLNRLLKNGGKKKMAKQEQKVEEKKEKKVVERGPGYISGEDKEKYCNEILAFAKKFGLKDEQLSKVLSTTYYTVRGRIKE